MLLRNDLGSSKEAEIPQTGLTDAPVGRNGQQSVSVKEAVRIAQSNNFMGLVFRSKLMVRDAKTVKTIAPC